MRRALRAWLDTKLNTKKIRTTNALGKNDMLGTPLQKNNLGTGEFAKLRTAAGVKRVTFHALRHTSATLLLQALVPIKVVSERLWHSKISTTMDTYAHVLPSMGRGAADTLGAILHG